MGASISQLRKRNNRDFSENLIELVERPNDKSPSQNSEEQDVIIKISSGHFEFRLHYPIPEEKEPDAKDMHLDVSFLLVLFVGREKLLPGEEKKKSGQWPS